MIKHLYDFGIIYNACFDLSTLHEEACCPASVKSSTLVVVHVLYQSAQNFKTALKLVVGAPKAPLYCFQF